MSSIFAPSSKSTSSTTPRWYYLATAFFILQTIGAFSIVDRVIYGEAGGKSTFSESINLLQFPVSFILFWIGRNKSKVISLGGAFLLTIVAFLFLSALWSVDQQTTLRRSFIYLFLILGFIGIANSLSVDEYIHIIRRVILLSAIASLILLVVSPGNSLMSDGPLRGVFTHKNVMGQVMAAGVLASLHEMRVGGGDRRSSVAFIILFAALAFAARSSTSLTLILFFCVADILLIIFWRNRGAAAIIMIIFTPAIAVLAFSPDMILGLLGKDATLTGRTDLWEYVKIAISQRPLLGWGFSAFWQPINPAAVEISTNLGWVVPQAHNGLLELLLEVGGLGTALFAMVFVRNVWIAASCLRTPAKELGGSLLLCCGGILLVGVSEEVLVDPAQISVGMLFVMGLMGEKMLRAVALHQQFRSVTPPLSPASARGQVL